MKIYPVSSNHVFWTIQGEAHLRGFQCAFLRLGGCSVGCPGCDTDYRVVGHRTVRDLVDDVRSVVPAGSLAPWVWITGGEPADHDLRPLIDALHAAQFSVAVASSGHKRVIPPVDWLSISPHDPRKVLQLYGNEVKLVEGLNGLDLSTLDADMFSGFMYRYVQPLSVNGVEIRESLDRCIAWLKKNPNWSLSRQDHLYWGVK